MPEAGFEFAEDKSEVQAEAKLAWPKERVAVLHGERVENTAAFEQVGWRTLAADDKLGRASHQWLHGLG